jgi:hypothetical protein
MESAVCLFPDRLQIVPAPRTRRPLSGIGGSDWRSWQSIDRQREMPYKGNVKQILGNAFSI